jgi:processive 1,2-diacylglycerol beta-glucosyltransferase
MIRLYDAESNAPLGAISEAQLRFLMDELEEESSSDRDYYISAETVEMLGDRGGDPELIAVLRGALAGRDGIDVRWESDRAPEA